MPKETMPKVTIKGMEMPSSCERCWLAREIRGHGSYCATPPFKDIPMDMTRPDWCPLEYASTEPMCLNQLAKEIHDNAVKHGWWDEERSFGDVVALCHTELSEAIEEYRNSRPLVYWGEDNKPEGIGVEMIDCIIRILDWCGKEGVDVDKLLTMKHEYNKTRPYRHGGKVM